MAQQSIVIASPFDAIDVSVGHDGKKIVLPAVPTDMSYKEAAKVLLRKDKEEEEVVVVQEKTTAFYFDGLIAFNKAMREVFGWVEARPTMTMFGPQPPEIVVIETDFGVRTEVLAGKFVLPGVEGEIYTNAERDRDNRLVFTIQASIKRKHAHIVRLLGDKTREIVARESIYRGKAIRLRTDDDGTLTSEAPTFFDISGADKMALIFSDSVTEQINVNLFTPIQYTSASRRLRIPLKRGVLLSGKYGTGKTLTATKTADICVKNGWTFILLDRVAGLREALSIARLYQPCVVFAEDIDRSMAGQERTEAIDDILNTIDGVESKGTEVFTVLTTNHLDEINQAMLRPGRLDAVIEITPPDAIAARKLMRVYGAGMIDENDPLEEAGAELEGQIPATIREATERSKLYALCISGGTDGKITDAALAASARQMKAHLHLLNRDASEEEQHTNEYKVGHALASLITEHSVMGPLDLGNDASIHFLKTRAEQTRDMVASTARNVGTGLMGAAAGAKEMTEKLEVIEDNTDKIKQHLVG